MLKNSGQLQKTSMTKVKICGITNLEDAALAVDLGADALGFIFYKDSPRYVREDIAKEIIRRLPPFVSVVGVFVDEKRDVIKEITEFCCLDLLQFHGDESPDFCAHFDKRLIKAFRVKEKKDLEFISLYKVNAVLLDTYYEDLYGGGGKTFNWQLAVEAKRFSNRVILAGGLSPDNISQAIQAVNPFGVDVSSGVESEPGKKDHGKVKEFIKRVKRGHK